MAARNHPSRTLAIVLVVASLLVAGACARKNPDTRPENIKKYVALGDSYTSGVGLEPYVDSACTRSDQGYPNLVTTALHIPHLVDVSCAGASSKNLLQMQTTPTGTNAPQLDAVTKDTDLVTLGLGLNDSGLSYALLYLCMPVNGATTPACATYLSRPQSFLDAAVRALGETVAADLNAIRKRAPKARVVLVGYPHFLPDAGDCPAQVPLPEAAQERIRTTLAEINDTMEHSARRARVDYVDMYDASQGHDVCSSDPWVNGQHNIAGKALAFHPFAAYHAAVAAKLEYLLEEK
jgi:lysophospholipase L1-like esterase